MSILLTGGTGYIGSHVAVAVAQLGHEIVLYDNLSNSDEAVVTQIAQIIGRPLTFIRGDIRDTQLLQLTLRAHGVAVVVHLAGLKAVGESLVSPLDYYGNNVQGTISLMQAMKAEGVRKIVFSSSATVYGQPKYLPLDEAHSLSATSPYGRSKIHIEELLRDVAVSDPSWSIACLRYFNPAGAHDTFLMGDNPKGTPNNLMPFIAQVAMGKRARLEVFGDDFETEDGTGLRDYIHIMDLAEGHAAALEFLGSSQGWHAINLGTGQPYSVLQMIRSFESVSGAAVPFEISARRPGDVAACYANANKAKSVLGWAAKRNLREICESTWRFQQTLAQRLK